MKRIGFIGLGHMGLPMAINCVKAGYLVTGYDLQPSAMDMLAKKGGEKAKNIAEIAASNEIIITMLQTGSQVEAVCLGNNGLFAYAQNGCHYIDSSTIDVTTARHIHEQARLAGLHCLDAPVSGGVAGAQSGQLTFMVGGDASVLADVTPVLNCMAKKIIHAGDAGNGQAAKICNNMILGISMIAVSEAFILAKKLNLPSAKLHEIVSNASGQCWTMDNYVPVPDILKNVPANQNYQPGFTAEMMLKDLKLSQLTAKEQHQCTPMGEMARKLYQKLVDAGHSDLDFSAIIQLINKMKD